MKTNENQRKSKKINENRRNLQKSTKNQEKPINFSQNDSIENITEELNVVLEKMIMLKPEQWIWSHNRWK